MYHFCFCQMMVDMLCQLYAQFIFCIFWYKNDNLRFNFNLFGGSIMATFAPPFPVIVIAFFRNALFVVSDNIY